MTQSDLGLRKVSLGQCGNEIGGGTTVEAVGRVVLC